MKLLVGSSRYLENRVHTGEPFNPRKFAENFIYYEPALIGIAQPLSIKQAITLALVTDVLRRITPRIKATSIIVSTQTRPEAG